MHRIRPEIVHYHWGDTETLPALLGAEPDGRPWAELWAGTHAARPSRLDDGRALAELAGDLPFLLKVLAIARPLSIQVHPDAAQAAAGFAAEEARGIALSAPERNYRDPSAKPELLLATRPTQALCGFREPAETLRLLDRLDVAELAALRAPLAAGRVRAALAVALRDLPATAADRIAAAAPRLGAGEFAALAHWLPRLGAEHPGDPGVAAALLLRHVDLAVGSALFLDAGVVHAYLVGGGVEVMATSDNVLRAGLTSKPVDVDGLLSVVDDAVRPPRILTGEPMAPGLRRYAPDVGEFELLAAESDDAAIAEVVIRAGGHRLLLVLQSRTLAANGLPLRAGDLFWVDRDESVVLTGAGSAAIVGGRSAGTLS